ncbi:phosphodiesterase [Haematococcus lacustris]|uniref:Phosphodiesterase n=1 Tax=Haematococcus lacustris TaxID=44745 RepID=A0A699ZGV2_HAELA|nr:phosphodiesterase [Haematococcus lacustris]
MVMKVSDLGHLAHAKDVHRRWVQLLEEELFRQGDLEVAAGLPVSPLMDRTKAGVTRSQAGFFSLVCLPQLQAFTTVFSGCQPMLDQARVL